MKGNKHEVTKAVGFLKSVSHRKVGNALLHTVHGNSEVASRQMWAFTYGTNIT